MSYNVNQIQAEMLFAMKKAIGRDWYLVKDTAKHFVIREKESLSTNFNLDLNNDNFKLQHQIHINRLRFHMKLEFLMTEKIPKITAEAASDSAMDIVDVAMKKELSQLLMPFTLY